MRFKPKTAENNELRIGDVRRFNLNEGGEATTFVGVVVGIGPSSVKVRRCYKEDRGNDRYQIKDVGETGLEYALFIDSSDKSIGRRTAGMRYGRLSKRDMKNIRL